MQTLTKKQKQIFDFITAYIRKVVFLRLLMRLEKNSNLKAVSTVHEHIALKEKGYLSKSENLVRGITPQKEIKSIIEIPIVGKITPEAN